MCRNCPPLNELPLDTLGGNCRNWPPSTCRNCPLGSESISKRRASPNAQTEGWHAKLPSIFHHLCLARLAPPQSSRHFLRPDAPGDAVLPARLSLRPTQVSKSCAQSCRPCPWRHPRRDSPEDIGTRGHQTDPEHPAAQAL